MFKYLQYVSTNFQFTISVLQNIIQERITAKHKLRNKGKKHPIFKVGDVVKSHIQVYSKSETGEVKNYHIKQEDRSKSKYLWETISMKYNETKNHNLQ